MPAIYLLTIILFSFSSSLSFATEPQIRLGAGAYGMKLKHSPQGLPDNDFGGSIFAEHTQNNFAGSRFILYNIDNDDVSVHGGEIQLLLGYGLRSEEHTSELQSRPHLVCRLLLEKKNKISNNPTSLNLMY